MIAQFQACTPRHPNSSNLSSSSSSSFRPPYPCFSSVVKSRNPVRIIRCSISQVHSYGTVDYENRPFLKWKSVYKQISFEDNLELGSDSILDQWERNYGHSLSKWELCRIVKELRKYGRHKHALEVYEWMNNKTERFRLSTSDAAIQLDLIAKVHGVPSAEEFFNRLPDDIRDKKIYGALHNSYVQGKMREQAESLMEQMRDKRYCDHALPYNLMMGLYMKFKDYDKVESLISEMMGGNIKLDIFSYNIWLSCRGGQGSVERMEQVFELMKLDSTVYPNWTSFSIMATMYISMGELEKAKICLRNLEGRITGRDSLPYHHLITLYGKIDNKDEVYRVWDTYKSSFPTMSNTGYVALIASLTRVGDIDGAEKMYEEWVAGKTYYDPRIPNLLINVYVREGNMKKAESFFSRMVEQGGKPHPRTFEILAEGHIADRKIAKALSYLKEAYSLEGSTGWRLKPVNMGAFSSLCEEAGDLRSKEILDELVRQSRSIEDEEYAVNMGLSNGVGTAARQPVELNGSSRTDECDDDF